MMTQEQFKNAYTELVLCLRISTNDKNITQNC